MAVQVNFWKCSEERYNQYLNANAIVDTDFYLVKSQRGVEALYLGKVLLSDNEIKEEDIFETVFNNYEVIFDGGDSSIVLGTLDELILE